MVRWWADWEGGKTGSGENIVLRGSILKLSEAAATASYWRIAPCSTMLFTSGQTSKGLNAI